MNWINLTEKTQLEEINAKSAEKPQVIFKHSTRCSISKTAWNRVEKSDALPDADYYYLDLISHRDISNAIPTIYGIEHESPQVIVIKNGKASYDADHFDITVDDLTEAIQ